MLWMNYFIIKIAIVHCDNILIIVMWQRIELIIISAVVLFILFTFQ